MAKNTSNIDLVKPGVDEFYDVNIMNSNLDKIDSYTGEIKNKIYNGSIQNTNLQLGCNRIQIPEISVSPKIEFTGFSYINLLGKDGNCEDLSKWNTYNSILSLDTVNKVSGTNCIKVIANPDYLSIANRTSVKNHIGGKKVLVSLYIKTNVTDSVYVRFSSIYGGGTGAYNKSSPLINTSTSMTRIGYKLDLSDSGANDLYFWVVRNAPKATEMYVDGIMANVISDVEYANVSVADLLTKYPYVDSYGCLTNPYFENRRYNLVRNGNCEEGNGYWSSLVSSTYISIVNEKFRVTNPNSATGVYQRIPVKMNTDYYISANLLDGTAVAAITIYDTSLSTQLRSFYPGTFNSGNNSVIAVYLHLGSAGFAYFDSIMLIEGNTAPHEYKSCDVQHFVVEGQFTSDDKVTIENDHVSGLLNWKHRTLLGKDYDWQFESDNTGFKIARLLLTQLQGAQSYLGLNTTAIKYDGKILIQYTSTDPSSADGFKGWIDKINVSISDANSGWAESVNPNNDEVKALMNGWKAVSIINNRYCAWTSIVDKLPPTGTYSTLALATVVGQYSMTVVDGSKFKIGRKIIIVDSTTGLALYGTTVSGINGNVITTGNALTSVYPAGTVVADGDDGVNDTTLLNYCKNNVAPGYEGYRLLYKLANPESITDTNIHVEGQIWDLVKGDNYVNVDSGIVLKEITIPSVFTGNTAYSINVIGHPSYSIDSPLKNKVESIQTIYRNGLYDNYRWTGMAIITNAYGNVRADIPAANFDTNATYTVDYQILKTIHTQTFGSLSMSYPQSIISALEGHSKALEQKQPRNSALDNLIDLSIYEEFSNFAVYERALNSWGAGYVIAHIKIPIAYKKCIPVCSISFTNVLVGDATYNYSIIPLSDIQITTTLYKSFISIGVTYKGSDDIIRNNLRNYGMRIAFNKITLDCRGRI